MEKAKKRKGGEFLLASNLDNGMQKWHPAVHLDLIYLHIVQILWLVRAHK